MEVTSEAVTEVVRFILYINHENLTRNLLNAGKQEENIRMRNCCEKTETAFTQSHDRDCQQTLRTATLTKHLNLTVIS